MKRVALALLPVLLWGCLPDVMVAEPRYFAPRFPGTDVLERTSLPGELPGSDAMPRADAMPSLRLRRVQSAVHLRERIVWRRSETEFGFHELSRWTQPPAHWVEQWLSRELFERRGLRRALAGAHPLLRVDVLAFDEVRAPERAARVELTASLSDAGGVALLERTYSAQYALEGRDMAAVARAMGAALADAVARLGADAADALAPLRP